MPRSSVFTLVQEGAGRLNWAGAGKTLPSPHTLGAGATSWGRGRGSELTRGTTLPPTTFSSSKRLYVYHHMT